MMAKLITQPATMRKIPGSIPALATQGKSKASYNSIYQHKLTQSYIISLNAQNDFEISKTYKYNSHNKTFRIYTMLLSTAL